MEQDVRSSITERRRAQIACNRRLCAKIVPVATVPQRAPAPAATALLGERRYEVLPFGTVHEQAAQLPERVRVTMTTSPKHGVDRSLEFAAPLRRLGHPVTLHIA